MGGKICNAASLKSVMMLSSLWPDGSFPPGLYSPQHPSGSLKEGAGECGNRRQAGRDLLRALMFHELSGAKEQGCNQLEGTNESRLMQRRQRCARGILQ